jgi:hypothetical protein
MGVSLFFSMECSPDPRLAYRPLRAPPAAPTMASYLISPASRRNEPAFREAARWAREFQVPAAWLERR